MWKLDYKESWAPKNWCFWTVVLEKTLDSPLDSKEIQPVHPEGNQFWIFIGRTNWNWNSNTLATWREELTHWKRPWYWERLRAGGEGDDRGSDGWKASPTLGTRVWASSRSCRLTGRPGMLQSWGCRVRYNWATELNWTSSLIADDPSALPFPHHLPVAKSSYLFTWCQLLYASHSTVLLHFSRYFTIRLKNVLFLCLFLMYYLHEKHHTLNWSIVLYRPLC